MSDTDTAVVPSAGASVSAPKTGRRIGRLLPVPYFARQWLLPWAAVLVLGTEITVLSQRGMQWRGDLIWTIDWLPVAFVVVGPIVAGCAAVETARTTDGAGHLFRNPVTRTPAFAVALAYTLVLGVVHLLAVAAALLLSRPPVGDSGAVLAVTCQLLILAFFAALGTAAGRFAGPVLAGVCGALAAFAAVYLASSPGTHLVLLEIGGATLPRVGYGYNVGHLTLQAAALLLVTAALLVLRPLDGRRHRQVTPRDGVLAGILVAGVVAISATTHTDRLHAVEARPDYCGAVIDIPTCFYRQHERVAETFQDQFWVIVQESRAKGYGDLLPARVTEASRTWLPQTGDTDTAPFFIMDDHLAGARPTVGEIISGMVQPVHCPQVQGDAPPSDRYWNDLLALTASWADVVEPGAAESMGYFEPRLSPVQAEELLRGFRTCTYPHF